jgi:hypothetical protein
MSTVTFLAAKNGISAKLAVVLLDSDLSMTLDDASDFPLSDPFIPFHLVVNNSEIVKVTNRVGNVLTIERAVEGTTAAPSVATGKKVALNITAAYIQELQAFINIFIDVNLNTTTVSSNYTIASNDHIDRNIFVNATSGNKVITLPSVSNILAGTTYCIKKVDASVNLVTITADSGQYIDGIATYILELKGEFVTIVSDGNGWQVTAE